MGKKGPNGEYFHAYRETRLPREAYYTKNGPSSNSGKRITCRLCGEDKSAVGSRNQVCKPCHQKRWRSNKELPELVETYGNSYRTTQSIPPAYKRCQSCRKLLERKDFTIPTRFQCPRELSSSTCVECRVNKNTLPLVRRDKEFLIQLFNGMCCSCGEPALGKAGHIDHCHRTGVIRGVLCSRCNLALGLLRDDRDVIRLLGQYLAEGPHDPTTD